MDALESPEMPEAPAVVEGRVLHAVTGDPIAGAWIGLKLAGWKGSGFTYMSKWPTLDGGVTDEFGRFRAEVLPRYYVPRAEKAGFVPGYGFVPTIILEPGETRTGVELKLHEEGIIAGRVLDESGRPIPGAEVQAYVESHSRTEPVLRSCGRVYTDLHGNYRVTHLRPARYWVSAKLPDLALNSAFRLFFYPGVTGYEDAETLEVGPGTVRPAIDFRLRPVSGVTVSGRVTEIAKTFSPLLVYLYPLGGRLAFDHDQYQIPVEERTGKFSARLVPPGHYRLAAFQQNLRGGALISGQMEVTVGSSDLTGLSFELDWGVRLYGRVQAEGLVALAPVRVALIPESRIFALETSARSDAEGRFMVTDMRAEPHEVQVSQLPEGYFVSEVLLNGQDVRLSLDPAQAADGELVIKLVPGAAKLSGQITLPGEEALADRSILLFHPAGDLRQHTRTDAQGEFTLAGIEPGDYRIAASNRSAWDPLAPAFAAARPLTLARHEVRWLHLGHNEFVP